MAITNIQKVDAYTLSVDVVETQSTTCDLQQLHAQRTAILYERDRCLANLDAQLADVDMLIAEAVKLGVISAPVAAESKAP